MYAEVGWGDKLEMNPVVTAFGRQHPGSKWEENFAVYLERLDGSTKAENGGNLYLTEMMNGITISSADVKRKLMTVTKESQMATEMPGGKGEQGCN